MNNKETIIIPILLVGFNRPNIISQSLEHIRKVKPTKLYVAIDGPRNNKPGEEELVNQVKSIVSNIDWNCEVYYRFSDKNIGAEVNVSSAVSWVLEHEEYVIVLEDDIILEYSGFLFMQEMLIRYKIMMKSALLVEKIKLLWNCQIMKIIYFVNMDIPGAGVLGEELGMVIHFIWNLINRFSLRKI